MNLSYCEVTVYCLTYNHDKYIRKTLESFVQQKTTFSFRVIVHDDASSDSTKKIIQEYADKYPSLIVPVYQDENQYSKGVSIYQTFIFPLVNSKYVACCEGDDYWCDSNKLQIQYDYMESHLNCALCVHNTQFINEDGAEMNRWFNSSADEHDYTIDDVIRTRGGGLFHTSAFFYHSNHLLLPDGFLIDQRPYDYNRAIYLASNGYVHYFPNVMSRYRVGSNSSWVKIQHKDTNKLVAFNNSVIEWLDKLCSVIGEEHKKAVNDAVEQYKIKNLFYQHPKWHIIFFPAYWSPFIKYRVSQQKENIKRKIYSHRIRIETNKGE